MKTKGHEKRLWNPLIPWRYLVPRKHYRYLLKVSRKCPEITPNIDREAFYKLIEAVFSIPYAIIWLIALPFILIGGTALVVVTILPQPPRLNRWQDRNTEQAESIMPLDEIRRRVAGH